MNKFFIRHLFFHLLRIVWNLFRCEFEHNPSRTKFVVENLCENFVKQSEKEIGREIYFAYVSEHCVSFWDQKLKWPLLEGEGDGRVCIMFSTKYPNILFIQTAANNIYYCSKSLRLEENKHWKYTYQLITKMNPNACTKSQGVTLQVTTNA